MHQVEQEGASRRFALAWQAAGRHLGSLGGEGLNWLRANLDPPLAEHLSFRIGNRLFFVFVEPTDDTPPPSSKKLFLSVAEEATAIPVILKMEPSLSGFRPAESDWGLRHAVDKTKIDPFLIVDDVDIPMSAWELHDFAVQIVKGQLESSGKQILASQPSPHIDPSIWFQDVNGPAFVVVRHACYPEPEAVPPSNLHQISESCRRLSDRGYFCSVSVANATDIEAPPLRGHGLWPKFSGLKQIDA